MLVLATLIGGLSGFVGMNLSYHLDIASGPTIVLTGAALFATAFAVTGTRRTYRRQDKSARGSAPVPRPVA